jgi:hypothetical protein
MASRQRNLMRHLLFLLTFQTFLSFAIHSIDYAIVDNTWTGFVSYFEIASMPGHLSRLSSLPAVIVPKKLYCAHFFTFTLSAWSLLENSMSIHPYNTLIKFIGSVKHTWYSFTESSWRPPGRYGANSCPMAVFSDFWWSPGHAALGVALRIASAHRHGHRNGPRQRCICSLPLPISTAVIVAKDHVMVH